MDGLLILSSLLGLLILATGWRFVHQLKRKHVLSSLWWSTQGLALFGGFLLVLLTYSNLHTYNRLTYEDKVADVYVRQLGAQKFQLSLAYSEQDSDQHYFVLQGDQWQLDARILKWKSWANLLGLDSYYQLDRLSGRYADIKQARLHSPTVHELLPPDRGLDIWRLKQHLRDNMGFVDTLFGQGVFMPMIDGAHYRVFIGQSGLITRPANDVAKSSVL